MQKWPIRLRIERGESLSSWFSRMAFAYGHTPQTFYKSIFSSSISSQYDFDRFITKNDLGLLSKFTGTSIDEFYDAMLAGDANVPYDNYGKNSGFLLTNRFLGSPKRRVISVCPQCLCASKIPYIKKEWRRSYVTVCSEHKIKLIDQCPKCGKPFFIDDSTIFRFPAVSCSGCGLKYEGMKVFCSDNNMISGKYFQDVSTGRARVWRASRRLSCIVGAVFGSNSNPINLDIKACIQRYMHGSVSDDEMSILFNESYCNLKFAERCVLHRYEVLKVAFRLYEEKFKIHFPNAYVRSNPFDSVLTFIDMAGMKQL